MTEKLLAAIHAAYPLRERDAGEYAQTVVNGMTVTVRCFDAEGLGNVSLMHGGVPGIMEMDTVVVNPFVRDMPLFSYDRILAGGKDSCFLELYDTKLSYTPDASSLAKLKADCADLPDLPIPPRWYDAILYPQSVMKAGSAEMTPRLDALTEEWLAEYLRLCALAPVCDLAEKKKAASAYTEGLLDNGGASTDVFLQARGKEFTQGLFRTALFGTGTP